jgi:hypothetical protein
MLHGGWIEDAQPHRVAGRQQIAAQVRARRAGQIDRLLEGNLLLGGVGPVPMRNVRVAFSTAPRTSSTPRPLSSLMVNARRTKSGVVVASVTRRTVCSCSRTVRRR